MKVDIYRKQLMNRMAMYRGIVFFAMIFIVFMLLFKNKIQNDLVRGYSVGACFMLQIFALQQIAKIRRGLNNDEILNEMFVVENDERRQFIFMKSGANVIPAFSAIIALAAIPASKWSMSIFYALVGVAFIQIAACIAMKSYWSNRI